jgi:hypothetical protein
MQRTKSYPVVQWGPKISVFVLSLDPQYEKQCTIKIVISNLLFFSRSNESYESYSIDIRNKRKYNTNKHQIR